jgi:hypothetical protein
MLSIMHFSAWRKYFDFGLVNHRDGAKGTYRNLETFVWLLAEIITEWSHTCSIQVILRNLCGNKKIIKKRKITWQIDKTVAYARIFD